jgi:CDP-diacylglycerol--glycerol-3-phosphate 3-phosphatidyltransferase
MTIYDLKPKFQNLLRPIVVNLANKGYTANQVTLVALALSFISGIIIILATMNIYLLLFIPIIMFVRMALNAIDGMLAKEHDMKTKKGAILNELSDVLSDVFLYLPFVLFLDIYLVVIVVILSIISEFTGVLFQAVYNDRRYDGPMGKSDRAFVFGLISLLLVFNVNIFLLNALLIISIILLCLTTYNRFKGCLK